MRFSRCAQKVAIDQATRAAPPWPRRWRPTPRCGRSTSSATVCAPRPAPQRGCHSLPPPCEAASRRRVRRHLAAVWHLADDVADLTGREVATPPPSHGSSMLIGGVRNRSQAGSGGRAHSRSGRPCTRPTRRCWCVQHHAQRHQSLAEWQRKREQRQCVSLPHAAAPRAKASVFGRMPAEAQGKAVSLSPSPEQRVLLKECDCALPPALEAPVNKCHGRP